MRTVSNQMLLSRKIFQIIFSSMSLLSQRYCIYDVAATILEWGFPSTTHTCVCTVSIQMLISISTIKENIQLTKIRLSQSLERDIFLHFYIIFENSEIVTTEQNLILNSAIYTASIQRSFGIQIAKENTTSASIDRGVDQFLEFGCLLALYISWEFQPPLN